MKLKTLIILIFISFRLYAQDSIAEFFINKTLLIEFKNGDYGSGLFYQDVDNVFIVTARHVIINEKKDDSGKTFYALRGDIGTVRYYSDDTETSISKGLEINFKGLFNKGYLTFSKTSDILICKIGVIDTIGYTKIIYDSDNVKKLNPASSNINGYSKVHLASFDESILGSDIFIFGYPKSLGLQGNSQYDFNRPILRKGVIAGKYVDNKTIVIDCPSFGGNSGGPVVEILKKGNHTEAKLIGIVVSFIPLTEIWFNARYNIKNVELVNSGYSVIEPIEKIDDLIKQVK